MTDSIMFALQTMAGLTHLIVGVLILLKGWSSPVWRLLGLYFLARSADMLLQRLLQLTGGSDYAPVYVAWLIVIIPLSMIPQAFAPPGTTRHPRLPYVGISIFGVLLVASWVFPCAWTCSNAGYFLENGWLHPLASIALTTLQAAVALSFLARRDAPSSWAGLILSLWVFLDAGIVLGLWIVEGPSDTFGYFLIDVAALAAVFVTTKGIVTTLRRRTLGRGASRSAILLPLFALAIAAWRMSLANETLSSLAGYAYALMEISIPIAAWLVLRRGFAEPSARTLGETLNHGALPDP